MIIFISSEFWTFEYSSRRSKILYLRLTTCHVSDKSFIPAIRLHEIPEKRFYRDKNLLFAGFHEFKISLCLKLRVIVALVEALPEYRLMPDDVLIKVKATSGRLKFPRCRKFFESLKK